VTDHRPGRAFEIVMLSASLLLVTACGNPTHEELLVSHVAPGGEYRVLYLDPPWKLANTDGSYLRLEIAATSARFGDPDASTVPPKFLFEASVAGGTASAAAQSAERAARMRGDEVLRPMTEIATISGASGFDLVTSRPPSAGGRFSRDVFLDRSGGIVRAHFEANNDLRDPEVDAMIADLTVDPE
jgi:hypothetical protein